MPEKSLILFDGVCNVCNGFVTFILPRDLRDQFQFGSLQSHTAAEVLRKFPLAPRDVSTVILIEEGKLFTRSTAVLRIARKLGGLWSLAYPLIVIPPFIRDGLYDFVARHRYRLFGKRDACMIPKPEWRDKFVD